MLQQRNMEPALINSWERIVPGIKGALSAIEQKTLIGFGMVPYPRIVPALFLKNYEMYAVKDTADLDVLRPYVKIFCLEEKFPKAAVKIHTASYLLGNYAFRAFLKSRRNPFRLLLHRTTAPMIKKLEAEHIEWIGNRPETFAHVWLKADFHALLAKLNLPSIGSTKISAQEIKSYTLKNILQKQPFPFLAQRAFSATGLEQSPFFIKNEDDWENMKTAVSLGQSFTELHITPLIEGLSLSMAGCITSEGVLTSSLQLQLVDIPQVSQNKEETELLVGYDFSYRDWGQEIEDTAQKITEQIGESLSEKGYKGIFGINFLYDKKTNNIYAKECMPQLPEDIHIYSLALMDEHTVPPLDFFHLLAFLCPEAKFHFKEANSALKRHLSSSHIFVPRQGIQEMKIPLRPGIYSYDFPKKELTFKREGAFPWELRNEYEFLMLDSMPRLGKPVIGNVPSLFKLVFQRSIAKSSNALQPDIAEMAETISTALRKNQNPSE
jgi:hypothetical protein